ncbi:MULTISPECIES: hypothetical protein [Polaribacter]|uniref:Tripartite tricarboxylate transporter TctB family protein n=2 Tax=Polaribacter sejongensis TaxID=985043 RepID=A0AAJ1QXA3_9FLAO|nr:MULTISPECIES: hypothetical protein [Polaribacter]MDN3619896.1 hypothetical protein [Polaribacter undariae]UWD31658.1 hypothetical protein NQP51_16190 [Polaribacter undariae]
MNDNYQINFSLKGFTSILIGAYFFIAGFFIETIVKGSLAEETSLDLPSKTTEILIITAVLLVFLFSSLTLFFNGKKNAKKLQHQLWNDNNKLAFKKYILAFVVIFTSLLILMNLGFITYLTPTFLILYGLLLFIFKNKERKNLLILSGLSLLLAVMCFLIPSYWASSISILGIAHVAYGVVVKN